MRFLCCFLLISGWSFLLRAEVNIDSIYASRYTKTLRDCVFEVGDVIRVPEIRFDLSGPAFLPGADSSFKQLADFYRKNPLLITEIQVHTDTRGQAENNLVLSLRRARAIVVHLVEIYGDEFIFAERILPVGKGESMPVVSESFIHNYIHDKMTVELLHQVNRRAELKITGFLNQNFYKNQPRASSDFDMKNTRNSAYYEDLILIADRALLEGNYLKALEFYSYAADLAPANETYAAEQCEKVRVMLNN